MDSRQGAAIGTLVFLAAVLGPAMPAAESQSGTTCTFEFDVVATPGLSTEGSSGTVASNGNDGMAECNGPVNGKSPTGPGSSGYDGYYGTADPDTCQDGGEGKGTFTLVIPTADGDETVADAKNTFTYGTLKAGGIISGEFKGERISGTFQAAPTKGDCASSPVTGFRVTGKGVLK
jgi:hypothetical protein